MAFTVTKPDLIPAEHLEEILEQCDRQSSSLALSKHQVRNYWWNHTGITSLRHCNNVFFSFLIRYLSAFKGRKPEYIEILRIILRPDKTTWPSKRQKQILKKIFESLYARKELLPSYFQYPAPIWSSSEIQSSPQYVQTSGGEKKDNSSQYSANMYPKQSE